MHNPKIHPVWEENLWWVKYRMRQRRKKRLSLEKVVRRSFSAAVMEYMAQSSLVGVTKICDSRIGIKRRFVWLILFLSLFGITCYFLQYIWFGTLTKPLVVTMESSTYPITEIDFPAVAFCNINRISKKAVREFAKEIHPSLARNNESLEEVEYFFLQLGRLLDFSWDEHLRNHRFLDYISEYNFDSRRIVGIMKKLAPSCDEMLLKCAWDAKIVNCSDYFAVRRTVRGHCCAFNYVLDYDSAGRPNKTLTKALRQKSPGFLHGLNVVLDVLVEDYAYPLTAVYGFDVLLFDPTHFADLNGGRVIHRIAEANKIEKLELQSVKQVATNEVRKYPLTTRKCLFHDEKKKVFSNMYSYSACLVNCRINTVLSLCKCTPYFFPTGAEDGPVCGLDELRCLNKYKEKLLYLYPTSAEITEGLEMELQDSLQCSDCLPDCENTQHYTVAYKTPISIQMSAISQFSTKEMDTVISEDINLTNKCIVSVYQPTEKGILNRLDVISYWFEVLSNIGGFAGILLGFSFISVAEIIYFIIIRFICLIIINYNKYR